MLTCRFAESAVGSRAVGQETAPCERSGLPLPTADAFLAELRPNAPAPLEAPLRRALTSAGKRVRGVLTIAAGEAVGGKPERLVRAAAAMEMIHASSLILDDLPAMDDALLRRGAPTLHREFGEDLAILSAVALLNHAYGLIASA